MYSPNNAGYSRQKFLEFFFHDVKKSNGIPKVRTTYVYRVCKHIVLNASQLHNLTHNNACLRVHNRDIFHRNISTHYQLTDARMTHSSMLRATYLFLLVPIARLVNVISRDFFTVFKFGDYFITHYTHLSVIVVVWHTNDIRRIHFTNDNTCTTK